MATIPKAPTTNWLHSYLEPGLVHSPPYKIDAPKVELKIDQNESPFDWPESLKKKVCDALFESQWNRYPEPYPKHLEKLVAQHVGVEDENILLSPGSNHLISLVLSIFGPRASKVVIARPSFPLYESHCKYTGIPYEPWLLNSNLEYDFGLLPKIPSQSLIVFASPNNPVGNVLSRNQLKELLTRHPDSLFVGDEAYLEFADEPYTDLLADYENLILIRTFSKTMAAAGVRLGYLIAHSAYIEQVRKLMVPFLLNRFTLAAIPLVLSDASALKQFDDLVRMTMMERDSLATKLSDFGKKFGFTVKNSQANFLLVRFITQDQCMLVYQHLIQAGILVRNVSGGELLRGCLRITVGTPLENQRVVAAFQSFDR